MIRWFVVLMLPVVISASSIEHNIIISPAELNVEKYLGYDRISVPGYNHTALPGHPALPTKILSFIIPADAEFENIEVISEQGEYLTGSYTVFPAQKPVPVSFSQGTEFTSPDENVYTMNELYPNDLVAYVHQGNLMGYRLISVQVTPLRYNPVSKKLYLSTCLNFRINYRRSAIIPKKITEAQKMTAQERVKSLVENKADVERFAPSLNRGLWQTEYFIITDQNFVNAFKPLKEWKMRKGVITEIVTTQWIIANYTGYDNAEKMRNFIIQAADSGAMYFLLGGRCDYEHADGYVYRRDTWCMTSNAGGPIDEDTIPCDLYFADLDRNWDWNNNHTYGESGDWVDMYSDVYVGRAPVKSTAQIEYFINKVRTYETAPSISYIHKILLPVGNLWTTNHGNAVNDTIADTVPNNWKKAKLYQDYGLMSRYIVRDSIDQGYNLGHFVGHGNEYGIYYNYGGSTYYYYTDPGTQINDSTDAVITSSIGCFCGAPDKISSGSMAERMINSNKKCATAAIMNSRYGWGYSSPANALGPSDMVSLWFFRKLFGTNAYHLGEVHAAGRDQLAPWAGNLYYRWSLYENNLFGDPEMPIWTDSTKILTVSFSDTIAIYGDGKTDTFNVTVQHSGSPVNGALVTLMQDSTGYARATTSAAGIAQFILDDNTFQHQGDAWVTATYYSENYLPYLSSGYVAPDLAIEESPTENYLDYNVRLVQNPVHKNIAFEFGAPLRGTLQVKVYDVRGTLVESLDLALGASELTISTSTMSSGIYFVKAGGEFQVDEKIIVLK